MRNFLRRIFVGSLGVLGATLAAPVAWLATAAEPVTLRYANFTAATIAGEKELIAKFEAQHPDIKIELLELPLDNYKNNLEIGARAGTNPDVFQAIPEWLYDFKRFNVVADLAADEKANFAARFSQGGMAMVTIDEGIYGAPFRIGISGVFINKKLFADATIPVPTSWTWDEFQTVAEKLTDVSKGQYGFAVPVSSAQADLGSSWIWLTAFSANGGRIIEGGKAAINGDIGVATLTKYIEPYQKGMQPKEELSWVMNDVIQAFGAGKVAMFINGPWYISTVQQSFPTVELGIVEAPTGSSFGSAAGGTFISISAQSKNVEAARTFVNFMTSDPTLSEWAKAGAFLYPLADAKTDDPLLQPFVARLNKENVRMTSLTPVNTQLMSGLQAAIEAAISGRASPKDALDQAAKEWDELLAKSQ